MANHSKSYPTNPELREEIAKLMVEKGLTNPEAGRLFGVSATFISKYKNDKLDHDPEKFEAEARDIIQAIRARLELAGLLFETSVTKAIAGRVNLARKTGQSFLAGAPAGEGKTSGGLLYKRAHPSSLYFKLSGPERTADDVTAHLFRLVRQADWSPNTQRWPAIVEALRGSERAIFCDNAHRLDTSGRNALFDLCEDTGCPPVFLANPEVLTQIKKNDQQHSRIGIFASLQLSPKELPAVALRVMEQFLGEEAAADVDDLAAFIASKPGRLRAVRMTAILAQELRVKDSKLDAREAVRSAHKQLVRDYSLPND
jgi:DNA transposition AAA+ family ATPase